MSSSLSSQVLENKANAAFREGGRRRTPVQYSPLTPTQQFTTASSMGRLTLNILLSFAQYERETIAERTRDKLAAAGRKGIYQLMS